MVQGQGFYIRKTDLFSKNFLVLENRDLNILLKERDVTNFLNAL